MHMFLSAMNVSILGVIGQLKSCRQIYAVLDGGLSDYTSGSQPGSEHPRVCTETTPERLPHFFCAFPKELVAAAHLERPSWPRSIFIFCKEADLQRPATAQGCSC
jgi:hypothetical protein